MTIKTKSFYDTRVKSCPTCNKFFNPFGKRHAAASCCGNTWKIFQVIEVTVTRDDGRDNHGRFNHKPKNISRTSVDI